MASKVSKLLFCLTLTFAAIIGLIIAVSCFSELVRLEISLKKIILSFLIIFILTVLFSLFSEKCTSDTALAIIIFLLSLAVRGVFIYFINTQPDSDFLTMYDAAKSIIKGDLSWLKTDYFTLWAYQIPFVAYEALILKVFGSMAAIKLINVIFMAGINLLVYKLARFFASKRAAFACSALYGFCPESVFLAPVLTNQHVSLFFVLLGLYLILKESGWLRIVPGAMLLSLGHLLRPEGLIAAAALVFTMFVWFLKDSKNRSKAIIDFILLIFVFFGFLFLSNLAFKASGLAPNGLINGCPEWKFVLGLDPEQKGTYNETNAAFLWISDSAARKNEVIRLVRSNFPTFDSFVSFIILKTSMYYGSFIDGSWTFTNMDVYSPSLFGISLYEMIVFSEVFDRVLFAAVSVLTLTACIRAVKERKKPIRSLLFCAALICVYFAAYLLIEVQARYRYFITPFLFIFSAYALDRMKLSFFGNMPNIYS